MPLDILLICLNSACWCCTYTPYNGLWRVHISAPLNLLEMPCSTNSRYIYIYIYTCLTLNNLSQSPFTKVGSAMLTLIFLWNLQQVEETWSITIGTETFECTSSRGWMEFSRRSTTLMSSGTRILLIISETPLVYACSLRPRVRLILSSIWSLIYTVLFCQTLRTKLER